MKEQSEDPPDTSWKKHKDWKSRYSQLYGNRRLSRANEEEEDDRWQRISFMTNENTPYTALLMKVRANRRDSSSTSSASPKFLTSILSQQSDLYGTYTGTGSMLSDHTIPTATNDVNQSRMSCDYGKRVSEDLGGHETLLLDMVRARSRELQDEEQDQTLDLPNDDNMSDGQSSEACVHGLSMRMTERSVSRSRVSRLSTRRDMDIPSILAFTTTTAPPDKLTQNTVYLHGLSVRITESSVTRSRVSRLSTRRDMDIPSILAFTTTTAPPVHLGIPAFTKISAPQQEVIPRWSIRRSVCPVCSQKWKDKSSILNIKYSGLKRNSSLELPSVIAPARLRTAITLGYVPRPVIAAIDREVGLTNGGLRNTSATWQLTRARRFRTPKLQLPSAEATAPPKAAAPLAQRDLDLRVSRFLTDMEVKIAY